LTWITRYRRLLAVAALGIGLATVITGAWLETRNPRSNAEDIIAWRVLAVGMFLLGVGVSLPFARPIIAVLIGIACPIVAWWLLVCAFWIALYYNRWPAQGQIVNSGYQMIAEAKQIDDLLGPAWHQLSNYREPDLAEWQTESLFGGRYELSMRVSVRVDRSSGRVTEVVGQPQFRLVEIKEIRDSRQVSYNGNRQHEFGLEQWHQVVKAGGDFAAIGIQLNRNNPVPGFDGYRAAPRNGIQMRPKNDTAPLPIR
jgi:hypothetical protein